jgi:hypothetical protein
MIIAVILFVISLAGVGGAYMWKQYLTTNQDTYEKQLAAKEKQFNIDLIEKLKAADIKLGIAKQVMNSHIALSGIFQLIGSIIVEKVRLTTLDLSIPTDSSDIKVTVKGYGVNLPAVAYQSDVLSQLETYGLRKIVKNPMILNPTNDENGLVTFTMTASVDPSALQYAKKFNVESATPSATQ